MEHRPVFLAYVHSTDSNTKIGGRDIAQRSRSEILALAAAMVSSAFVLASRRLWNRWTFAAYAGPIQGCLQ